MIHTIFKFLPLSIVNLKTDLYGNAVIRNFIFYEHDVLTCISTLGKTLQLTALLLPVSRILPRFSSISK